MVDAPLFSKVLVANRGEIALRVMRACRELGIRSVAVYGDNEQNAPHVRYADEAFRLASERPLPYLDIEAILNAATAAGADAIHPGYGFLAENPPFARACQEAGIVFIGPPADAIAAMGDKIAAREVALRIGAPLVPGSTAPVDLQSARDFGDAHGYPLALKAAAGGGGRGFRVAWSTEQIEDAYNGASGEAERYFNDGRVYVERYLDRPRHIEIQVFADSHGNVVSLGERDCSIQRRHQKLIEESPSPALTPDLRRAMGQTAVELARAVAYRGAGTVEFLFQDGNYFFLEMNTRIQVEHPVTEMITGIDLVKEQIRIAAGQALTFGAEVTLHGHAIECRINAEDAARSFVPAPGAVTTFKSPAGFGVRVESAAESGFEILPQYDSLIAKLIAWGRDREEALQRMDRALFDFQVAGVPTTIAFHRRVIEHPAFQSGDYTTRFLEQHPELLEGLESVPLESSDTASGGELVPEEYVVEVGGKRFDVRLFARDTARPTRKRPPAFGNASRSSASAGTGRGEVVSPIQGTVLSVAVEEGASVATGDLLCVIEAMKMENEIKSPHAGLVQRLDIGVGQTVRSGAVIAVVEPSTE